MIRNALHRLVAYVSCSLGTNLADSETWPSEDNFEDERNFGENPYS